MLNITQSINGVNPSQGNSTPHPHFNRNRWRAQLQTCLDFGSLLTPDESRWLYGVACKLEGGRPLTPRQSAKLARFAAEFWNSEGLGDRALASLQLWGVAR